jgi:hypothetical protein
MNNISYLINILLQNSDNDKNILKIIEKYLDFSIEKELFNFFEKLKYLLKKKNIYYKGDIRLSYEFFKNECIIKSMNYYNNHYYYDNRFSNRKNSSKIKNLIDIYEEYFKKIAEHIKFKEYLCYSFQMVYYEDKFIKISINGYDQSYNIFDNINKNNLSLTQKLYFSNSNLNFFNK